jgi:hypothetical protein
MNLSKYNTYYKDGKSAQIKISKRWKKGKVIIKFKYHVSDPWMYHIPKYEFDNQSEIIAYILKHLESDLVYISVKPVEDLK